jgi:LL-diaminopimelate aminotransferase
MITKADRLQTVGEYYFSTKLAEIAAMQLAGNDVLNLGIGSPDMAPAPSVIEDLVQSAMDPKNHAYQPYRSTIELRSAVSAYYKRYYDVALDPEHEVLPLLGSKEGIMYISMAFLNPGDLILVPNPGYLAYTAISELIGCKVIPYDLIENTGWQPDLTQISQDDLSKVKLMWVNYPNMPTGAPATLTLFNELVSFGKEHDILICNDNPYSLVLNEDPISILSSDTGLEHVLELNSLSKSFNMAGWRVGMVLGHRENINAIIQAKSNVDSGMFLPVQHAAASALALPKEWHAERNKIYADRRSMVIEILETIGCSVKSGQVGLFIWAKVSDHVTSTRQLVDNILKEALVFITPGEIFGSNGDRYVRISLTSPKKTYEEALKRIQQWEAEQVH